MELNGQRPPAHFNCRSTTVPVLKSLKELGLSEREFSTSTRASMNGQVSAKETYSTWFAKQDDKFQKSVLGKGRYELYKSGQVQLDKFADNGRTMTLAQLGKLNTDVPAVAPFVPSNTIKEAEAWAKQNLDVRSVGYKGLSMEAVNDMNKSIYDNINLFPKLKDDLLDIGSTTHLRNQFVDNYVNMCMNDARLYTQLDKIGYSDARKIEYFTKFGRTQAGRTKSTTYAMRTSAEYKGTILRKGIGINPVWGKDATAFIKSMNDDVSTGWHPTSCNTIKSAIDHEMGHMLDGLLKDISQSTAFKNMVAKYNVADDLARYPTAYLTKNKNAYYSEILAEGWMEYMNNPTPRPFAKEIGEFIKVKYKEEFR
jgi:hypothetical protein